MFKPIAEYEFIAIALLYINYDDLCDRIKHILCDDPPDWNTSKWTSKVDILNIKKIIHREQTSSGAVNRYIVVWPIGNNRTAFLSNLKDNNAGVIYPLHLPNDFIKIRVSRMNREFPFNEFEYKKNNKERLIQVYNDNPKWIFWEKGEILPFENPEYYQRRIKKQRLNYEIINEYLEANGCFLNEENFWHSDTATYFIESHPNKQDEL